MSSEDINAVDAKHASLITDIEMISTIPVAATQPELLTKEDDPFLVHFSDSDSSNPLNWSTGKKWAVTDVLSATGFNRIMVSTIMAPALSHIAKDLKMNSIESVMALSIYLLATAFGPLVIGPLVRGSFPDSSYRKIAQISLIYDLEVWTYAMLTETTVRNLRSQAHPPRF